MLQFKTTIYRFHVIENEQCLAVVHISIPEEGKEKGQVSAVSLNLSKGTLSRQ